MVNVEVSNILFIKENRAETLRGESVADRHRMGEAFASNDSTVYDCV